MPDQTYKTAVVLIPPESCWPPIQQIRRQYDRQIRRWMPHITLVYPFRPAAEFSALVKPLTLACSNIAPFDITLSQPQYFAHRRGHYTIWLTPTPTSQLRQLQAAIQNAVPDCIAQQQHKGGFTPHLSLGQSSSTEQLSIRMNHIRESWTPLTFQADSICLIARGDSPDDVFSIADSIPLGGR